MFTLYDVHFHVQNLTHPHIEAFIDRLRKDKKVLSLIDKPVLIDLALMAAPIFGLYRMVDRMIKIIGGTYEGPTEAHLRILNLLLLMNQPVDEFLKEVNNELKELLVHDDFKMKGETFDEVLVSALIMDFSDRDYVNKWTEIAYATDSKPVVRQTEDLLAGIKRFNDGLQPGERKLSVLPFLGMNPENYGLRKESSYVILKAKLDRNNLPQEILVGAPGGRPKAKYGITTGRFEWFADTLTDQELNALKSALIEVPGGNQAEVSKHQLDDLQKQVNEGTGETTVQLLVNLREEQVIDFATDYRWERNQDEPGGMFTWRTNHMSEVQRKKLITALEKPTSGPDQIRSHSAWSYSVGRIEHVFKTLENQEAVTIQDLLEKYFGDQQASKADLVANQTSWPGNIDGVGKGVFAGIKLYPPLGFDPNPDGHIHENSRKKKAWYLYRFCQDRQIPITVHTSDGGFQIMSDNFHYTYTSPKRWTGVLMAFPDLRINFAHCGVQDAVMDGRHEWKRILFEDIMCARNSDDTWKYPNVYADLSDLLNSEEAYQQWEVGMAALNLDQAQWEHVKERLLFGSDFMINLRESKSYSEYLSRFVCNSPTSYPESNTGFILRFDDEELRYKMAVENPQRFLFPNG